MLGVLGALGVLAVNGNGKSLNDDYRVQLDVFTGPLDLLLYLIRRDELDIQDIPLARLTEQYLEHVRLLEVLDPNTAGDFLVMASTLVELKSRALLPTPALEAEDDEDDPRKLLVRQLLEYKRFKDAAAALGSAADERAKRFVRRPAELPRELEGVELEEVQVWDLLPAFGRVMSAIGQGPGLHEVTYDDTPIEEYRDYILDTLERNGTVTFQTLFADRFNRPEIVGLFLALLELLRWQRVRAEQDALHGLIYLFLMVEVSELSDLDEAAPHEHTASLAPRADESPGPRPETTSETQDEQTK